MYINTADPDRVPRGPWAWESTDRGGVRLVAADGAVILEVEDGYASPDLYNVAVETLLRRAWELAAEGGAVAQLTDLVEEARLWAWCLQHDKPLQLPGDAPPGWLTAWNPPVGVSIDLGGEAPVVARLTAELDEARRWARGYRTGFFDVDTDRPPAWLIAPLVEGDS